MFTNEDDFVVQMPPMKTEDYNYEHPSSISLTQDYGIKSESSTSFDFEVCKSDDQTKFGSEFISIESINGE